MRDVRPRVFLVAATEMIASGVYDYLTEIGAEGWTSNATSPPDLLAEFAGRLCYRSWKPGLNANVTKVREGNREYLANVISQRHSSVFEHASVSFIFHNVSRVFTHELVRHRVGVGISQESLRYVRLTDLGFWMPPAIAQHPEMGALARAVVEGLEGFQIKLANAFMLDDPGKDFALKKALTSAMRRFAPLGLATGLLWTANMRTLRHVIEQRTAPGAEEEIRLVFDEVARLVTARYPATFQDFARQDDGAWTPTASKI